MRAPTFEQIHSAIVVTPSQGFAKYVTDIWAEHNPDDEWDDEYICELYEEWVESGADSARKMPTCQFK